MNIGCDNWPGQQSVDQQAKLSMYSGYIYVIDFNCTFDI